MALALNNLQMLICHQTKKPNQTDIFELIDREIWIKIYTYLYIDLNRDKFENTHTETYINIYIYTHWTLKKYFLFVFGDDNSDSKILWKFILLPASHKKLMKFILQCSKHLH